LRKIALIGVSLVLTACATPEQKLSAHLDSNLDAMAGQPVEVAIDRLGEPSSSAQIGRDTIYSWHQAFASEVTTAAVGVGSAPGVYAPLSYASGRTTVVKNYCLLQAVVGSDGLIRYWHFDGNYAGCHPYAERLVPLALTGIE
jgi:hypothetical protein